MYPVVAIATRNNPHALCAMLGSLRNSRAYLSIADAGDAPIIQIPAVSRLLGRFSFTYQHSGVGHLVRQRQLACLPFSHDTTVLLVDDDVVFLTEIDEILTEFDGIAPAVFGQKVDLYNDRHYPDFKPFVDEVSNHHFRFLGDEGIFPNEIGQPDSGLVYGKVGHFLSVFEKVLSVHDEPGVQDDAFARLVCNGQPMMVDTRLKADHIGNVATWNIPWEARTRMVNRFVESME